MNAPEYAGKPDANQKGSQRDADRDFRGHADDNHLSTGRPVAGRSLRPRNDSNRVRGAYSCSRKVQYYYPRTSSFTRSIHVLGRMGDALATIRNGPRTRICCAVDIDSSRNGFST